MSLKSDIFNTLKANAEDQMARYPQYKGHFDGYIVVKVTKTIKTKLGTAFEKGEHAIAQASTRVSTDTKGKTRQFYTVYSLRNQCDTSVPIEAIEEL